jgi:hypothetical protein
MEHQRQTRRGASAATTSSLPLVLRPIGWAFAIPRRLLGTTVRVVLWLALTPLRLLGRSTAVAFRAGRTVGTAPLRVTAGVSRRLGAVGTVCLVAGVLLGLLVAPISGRQLRERIRTLVAGTSPLPDETVRAAVVAELATAPRTGDLPTQPSVTVVGGVVTLDGQVPHGAARIEAEAIVAGVPGVQGVVNHLATA